MPGFSRTTLFAIATAASTTLAACGGGSKSTGPTSQPAPAQVTVQATNSLAFTPSSVTVKPGGKVEFEFGSVAHTVVFSAVSGAPAEIPASSNVTVERTFASAGTFAYHCTIHPGMAGTVVVASTTSVNTGCNSYSC